MNIKPEVILHSFEMLKQALGNSALNVSTNKTVSLATINIKDTTYYLIQNGTKKNYEVILNNGDTVTLTSRNFISKIKPKKINEIFITLAQEDFQVLSTEATANKAQVISRKEVLFNNIKQEALDNHYLNNEYLNDNLLFSDYLFKIELPKILVEKLFEVKPEENNRLILHLDIYKRYNLSHTTIVNNIIYTNNILRVVQAIDKLLLAIPNTETEKLKQIRYKYSSDVLNIYRKLDKYPLSNLPNKEKFEDALFKLQELLK